RLTIGRDDVPFKNIGTADTVCGAQRIDRRGDAHDGGAGKHEKRHPQPMALRSKDGSFAFHQSQCVIRKALCCNGRNDRGLSSGGKPMPLAMNREVFITCAITGSGGTQDRSPHVPRSPKQIAESAIAAAKAGAAVVHCHVRDPETGKPHRDVHLYREVTERIREADVDVVLNLTAGMGGDMVFGPTESPLPLKDEGTDMAGA